MSCCCGVLYQLFPSLLLFPFLCFLSVAVAPLLLQLKSSNHDEFRIDRAAALANLTARHGREAKKTREDDIHSVLAWYFERDAAYLTHADDDERCCNPHMKQYLPSILNRVFFGVLNPLRSVLCSVLCSFLRSFVPSFLRSFVPSFLRSFLPSFLRSFVPSLLRSFVPSFLPSFLPSLFPASGAMTPFDPNASFTSPGAVSRKSATTPRSGKPSPFTPKPSFRRSGGVSRARKSFRLATNAIAATSPSGKSGGGTGGSSGGSSGSPMTTAKSFVRKLSRHGGSSGGSFLHRSDAQSSTKHGSEDKKLVKKRSKTRNVAAAGASSRRLTSHGSMRSTSSAEDSSSVAGAVVVAHGSIASMARSQRSARNSFTAASFAANSGSGPNSHRNSVASLATAASGAEDHRSPMPKKRSFARKPSQTRNTAATAEAEQVMLRFPLCSMPSCSPHGFYFCFCTGWLCCASMDHSRDPQGVVVR